MRNIKRGPSSNKTWKRHTLCDIMSRTAPTKSPTKLQMSSRTLWPTYGSIDVPTREPLVTSWLETLPVLWQMQLSEQRPPATWYANVFSVLMGTLDIMETPESWPLLHIHLENCWRCFQCHPQSSLRICRNKRTASDDVRFARTHPLCAALSELVLALMGIPSNLNLQWGGLILLMLSERSCHVRHDHEWFVDRIQFFRCATYPSDRITDDGDPRPLVTISLQLPLSMAHHSPGHVHRSADLEIQLQNASGSDCRTLSTDCQKRNSRNFVAGHVRAQTFRLNSRVSTSTSRNASILTSTVDLESIEPGNNWTRRWSDPHCYNTAAVLDSV